ncbi:hypothetical protein CBF23_003745 [Marinomonas agarivorans]|nr:hypothetical protein CBF23_003745 [Marinomonas agarivorans]
MVTQNLTSSTSTKLKFDAIGIEQLEDVLRERITEFLQSRSKVNGRIRKGSYDWLSSETGISTSYLQQFNKDKRSISIHHLNTLACHFSVRYAIVNFPPNK